MLAFDVRAANGPALNVLITWRGPVILITQFNDMPNDLGLHNRLEIIYADRAWYDEGPAAVPKAEAVSSSSISASLPQEGSSSVSPVPVEISSSEESSAAEA